VALTNSQYDHFMRIYEKDNWIMRTDCGDAMKRYMIGSRDFVSWISLFRSLVFDRHAGCWMEMRVRLLH